jgi:hypothetical protein
MPKKPVHRSLTAALGDSRSPVRLFLHERFPNARDVQRRYREYAADLIIPGNQANPATVGTAADWLLRFLVHPQPEVRLALFGSSFVPQHSPGLAAAIFAMCEALGIRTDTTLPPSAMSCRTFVGPVAGSAIERELLARGCWALALLTEFYRAGAAVAVKGPLGQLDHATTPDLLAMASPAALDQLDQFRYIFEQALLPRLASRQGTWALGPTFTGSALIHADADLIAAGLLLEVKTSQGAKRADGSRRATLDKQDLFQLISYSLLDFDDEFQITKLAMFSARFGYLATWPLCGLLNEMADCNVDLHATRQAFRDLLQRGRRKSVSYKTLGAPTLKVGRQ